MVSLDVVATITIIMAIELTPERYIRPHVVLEEVVEEAVDAQEVVDVQEVADAQEAVDAQEAADVVDCSVLAMLTYACFHTMDPGPNHGGAS